MHDGRVAPRGLTCWLWLAGVALWLCASATLAQAPAHIFRVGITAFRDKAVTTREWAPTMAYLSDRVAGARFVAVPLTLPEFEAAMAKKELDFVVTNPEHYIVLESKYGLSRVATMVKSERGMTTSRFGGVVFTRMDNPAIQRLEDLRGRKIAATDRTSFAAFLLQYDLLKEIGVDLNRDAEVSFLGFPQDLNVKAVLDGRADAGFVRSGLLESMAAEGLINLADVRVLNGAAVQDFPFMLSTRLYPEWPWAVAPQVPMDVANQVAALLLLLSPDSEPAKSARYHRWSSPLEYQSVEALMRRRHVYPFDKPEPLALRDVLREYGSWLMAAVLVIAIAFGVLYVRARRLNQALGQSRQNLIELAHHDPLTGLPNRKLLDDRMEQAMAQSRRNGRQLAVCLLDLDGFKPVNDRYGHKVGDELLQELAKRLTGALREGDTVARYGGDEFVLLLNDVRGHEPLSEVLNRLLTSVARRFDCCADAAVKASIGVSLFPLNASHATELFKQADAAMYQAKRAGGNAYVIQTPSPLPG